MFKKHPYLMAEDDDTGSAGAVDRGDETDELPPSTIDDGDDKEVSAEAEAAEELATRNEKGQFVKKEREERIPKARFDDAVGKERHARELAERRAAELEAQLSTETRSTQVQQMEEAVDALEVKFNKLVADGEHEKAAQVMKEIRHAERQIAARENDEKVANATSAAVEQVRMEAAIANMEAKYPAFNPDSEDFDQDLVDLVLAEQARLLRTTATVPSRALVDAATKIMNKFAPVHIDDVASAKGLAAAKGAGRKAEQVAKNLDTARRQPASTRAAGKDSDKGGEPVAWNGTREEFNALPDSTKAKLRGDFI